MGIPDGSAKEGDQEKAEAYCRCAEEDIASPESTLGKSTPAEHN